MRAKAVELVSEAFSAMGNVVAEGVWNQLGRPELDRLDLLLRESVQNSWDARIGPNIRYDVQASELSAAQRRAYATFFAKQPPAPAYVPSSKVVETISSIEQWLARPGPRVLVVSDRGTTGLDGPTRADRDDSGGGERNFVDFLRNVGQPPGREHTGGTFGYGKAAFYLASRARTIVVFTRCMHEGRLQTRLTAAALTHNYSHAGKRFTGRHWWGSAAADGVPEPILGDEASETANALGLLPFSDDDRGTTIAIVDPDFDDQELGTMGMACLRHFWPKLKSPGGERPPIALSLVVSNVRVPVPDPSKTAPYDAYWRAWCKLSEGQLVKHRSDVVGRLALEKAMVPAGAESSQAPDHERAPQHVALLRSPDLVVKYMPGGRSLGSEYVGFVGVFKVEESFDEMFARAEPPTHDDWQPSTIPDKRARDLVKRTLMKVREAVRDFAVVSSPRVRGAAGAPLADVASDFALLAVGARAGSRGEPGARSTAWRRGVPESRPRAAVDESDTSSIEEVDGVPHAVFDVLVTHARGSQVSVVRANVHPVVTGGGREHEPPATDRVEGLGTWWISPAGTRVDENPVRVGPRQEGRWRLFVPIKDDVALGLELDVSVGEP